MASIKWLSEIEHRVSDAIKRMKRLGTVSASFDFLKQNLDMRGSLIPVAAFHNLYREAASNAAKRNKFTVYE